MYKHFVKRLLDILVGLFALPFVILLIIIFAPIIYFTDRGPVFYCGKRVGRNGKPFRMIKFRSMKVNAPDIRLEDGSTYNGEDDPRVTRIGRFMRKTSIDEMPQFLNVLFGQMSLIGPRPDPLDWLDRYPEEIKVFLTVRPGITGYCQAYYRNSADGYEKMKQDAFYARNISFGLDVKIFFKTIATVFKKENLFKEEEYVVKEYGYEYEAKTDENLLKKTNGKFATKTFKGAMCLRSGRDALHVIAREYENAVAILPALSCDSMVSPFEKCGHTVAFYKYNEGLTIDLDSLSELFDSNKDKTVLFLFMDYFGIKSLSEDKIEEISKTYPNVIFIHDITHTLLYEDPTKFACDYTIASVRKWANIPDGGLLWTSRKLTKKEFSNDLEFFKQKLHAQELKRSYALSGDEKLKEEYRKIFSNVSNLIDKSKLPARMSLYSYELLKKYDFEDIRKKREQNSLVLIEELSKCKKIKLIQDVPTLSNLYVPFLIDDRDDKQAKLSKLGIFNTIIWPLRDEQKIICKQSKYIEEHMLAAPCDQRYTEDDIEHVAKEIVRIVNE